MLLISVFFNLLSFKMSYQISMCLQALLILNKEMETNTQIGMSCLPKYQESAQSLANRKCFVTSLEYVNGRYGKKISLIVSNGIDYRSRSILLSVSFSVCFFPYSQKPFLFSLYTMLLRFFFFFYFNRLIERTETIKIFEVDRCRDIFNHQNRLQIFFPKQNICAGHSNGQSIKIVSQNNLSK